MASGWTKPPARTFAVQIESDQKDRMRRAILIAMRGVVLRTPVGNPSLWKTDHPPRGYVGGRARANWQLTKNAPASRELNMVDKSGSRAISDAANAAVGPYDTWYLTNNVPYATRLEHGWSRQAPQGMVSLTLRELTARLR